MSQDNNTIAQNISPVDNPQPMAVAAQPPATSAAESATVEPSTAAATALSQNWTRGNGTTAP